MSNNIFGKFFFQKYIWKVKNTLKNISPSIYSLFFKYNYTYLKIKNKLIKLKEISKKNAQNFFVTIYFKHVKYNYFMGSQFNSDIKFSSIKL